MQLPPREMCAILLDRTFADWMWMRTSWRGATRGGRTRPLSSPCTMTITPIVRVVRPQEFCKRFHSYMRCGSVGTCDHSHNFLPARRAWSRRPNR